MTQTVLVTGGTGFVGGWCIVELLRRGYTVRTTVRSLAKEPAVRTAIASAVDAGDRLTFFAADLWVDPAESNVDAYRQSKRLAERAAWDFVQGFLFRLLARFDPSLRAMVPRLGRKYLHTSAKACDMLGWQPRSAAITVVDCARSLMPESTT